MYMNKDQVRGFGQISCVAFAFLCFCFIFPAAGLAQQQVPKPVEEYSASGLLSEATRLLGSQRYFETVPFLDEYIKRMGSNEEERVQSMVQEVRFKLGTVHFFTDNYNDAAVVLEEYLKKAPVYKWRQAHKYCAVSLYRNGAYDRAISTITNVFYSEPPTFEAKKKESVKMDDLSRKERGGFTQRQTDRYDELEANTRKQIVPTFSSEPEPESDYTVEELVMLHMTLAESYSSLNPPQWENSTNSYAYVIEHTNLEDQKGYAMMQMVNALIGQRQFDAAQEYVSKLYQTNARYDLRVNVALMNAAEAFFKEGKYDGSLMLYRMILPRKEMVDYQIKKMDEICISSGLPEYEMIIVTNESQKVVTQFGIKNVMTNEVVVGIGTSKIQTPPDVLAIQETIKLIQGLPAYEDEVVFRQGLLFARAGRPWEAVALLQIANERDPDGKMGQRALYEKLLVLVDPLQEYDWVKRDCLAFLDANTAGLLPRQLAYILSGSYQKQEKAADIKTLLKYIKGFEPFVATTADEAKVGEEIEVYEGELYFMQAVADLILTRYPEAEIGFADFMVNYPKSRQVENAFFWHAMTQLFQQKYAEALVEFEAYPEKYPSLNNNEDPAAWEAREARRAEALFRGGICMFSMEEYARAKERFTLIITTQPDSDFFSDACSLRGDLYAAETDEEGKGTGFDAAIRDYRTAIKSAKKVGQATYAVFQMADLLQVNSGLDKGYLDEIVTIVTAYLNKYEEQADVAKAAYWIGKTKIAQGFKTEAADMYLKTILKYGGDIKQDGVDSIIIDLAALTKKLEPADREAIESRLTEALSSSTNGTLTLRLRVLVSKINGTELELGAALIAEQDDLKLVPPPVLALICEASLVTKNYSRAADILKIFQSDFDESEFMPSAYKLRAYDLFESKDEIGTMKIIKEAEALYGRAPDMAWSQLMKGEIQLNRKEYRLAAETFEDILKERSWRGEPYAKAAYYLGSTAEAAGDPTLAFAWYQRTYVQYKGYAKGYWAAEAYLASARCLQKLGLDNDRRNTFRAVLFDKYVNTLPQADVARKELGAAEVAEIEAKIAAGVQTNITVAVEAEVGK